MLLAPCTDGVAEPLSHRICGLKILATCSQNFETADPVAERLGDAIRAWGEQHDSRGLRKALLAIMGFLDE